MAAGEYVSVSSQADTERADISREQGELSDDPSSEHIELGISHTITARPLRVSFTVGALLPLLVAAFAPGSVRQRRVTAANRQISNRQISNWASVEERTTRPSSPTPNPARPLRSSISIAASPPSIIAAVANTSAVAASPAITVTVLNPEREGWPVAGSMR